jgi:hypothetical protein
MLTDRRGRRTAFCAFALVVAGLASPAGAGPGCPPVLTDPAGDADDYYVPTKPQRADLDIVAVGLSNDRSTLRVTVAISRLASPPAGTADNYYVFFNVKDAGYVATAYRGLDATRFALESRRQADPTGTVGEAVPIGGEFSDGSSTVTMDVPLSLVGAPRSGARIYDAWSASGETVGLSGASAGSTIDSTASGRVYVLDQPGCAKR